MEWWEHQLYNNSVVLNISTLIIEHAHNLIIATPKQTRTSAWPQLRHWDTHLFQHSRSPHAVFRVEQITASSVTNPAMYADKSSLHQYPHSQVVLCLLLECLEVHGLPSVVHSDKVVWFLLGRAWATPTLISRERAEKNYSPAFVHAGSRDPCTPWNTPCPWIPVYWHAHVRDLQLLPWKLWTTGRWMCRHMVLTDSAYRDSGAVAAR